MYLSPTQAAAAVTTVLSRKVACSARRMRSPDIPKLGTARSRDIRYLKATRWRSQALTFQTEANSAHLGAVHKERLFCQSRN